MRRAPVPDRGLLLSGCDCAVLPPELRLGAYLWGEKLSLLFYQATTGGHQFGHDIQDAAWEKP